MVLSIAEFYAPDRWTLGFWEWGPDYTIVKNRHIGVDIGTGRRPIDVPCLYGGRVVIVTKTRSMGWVVVIDTGLPGNRRYHAYCHLSAYDLPRSGAFIGRGARVARLAAGPKGVAYENPDFPGTAWGGIHLHLVLCDVSFGAYTIGTGASFGNPETFIREQLSSQAASGGARPFEPGGFLMALTDAEQREIYNNICGGQQHELARVFADILLDREVRQSGRFERRGPTKLRDYLAWAGENVEGTRDLVRAMSGVDVGDIDVAKLADLLSKNLGASVAGELAKRLAS